MAKRRKLKKSVKKFLIVFILMIGLLIGGIKTYNNIQYKKTFEYKFLEKNYTITEFEIIDKLDKEEKNILLDREYNKNIPLLINEKYFMFKNLDRYLDYIEKNSNLELKDVVSLVNVNRDKDYYKDLEVTDVSNFNEMLVNKYHALDKDYVASDIVKCSSTYAYANNELNKEAYEAFKNMADAAREEGHVILILSSYRTYESQDNLWKQRKTAYGIKKADAYAARAGSSEHETGLAIDVAEYKDVNDEFGKTESFKWMQENAYKYGYILRYPEGKENITGYSYEAWHYRYLGVSLATKVYNEGITYDEYYEFYLNK